MREITCWRW